MAPLVEVSLLVVVAAVTVDLDLGLPRPPRPDVVELLLAALLGGSISIIELVTVDADVVAVIIAGGEDVLVRIVSSIVIESSALISTIDEPVPVNEVKSFKSIQLAPIRSQSDIGKLRIRVSFSSINWND